MQNLLLVGLRIVSQRQTHILAYGAKASHGVKAHLDRTQRVKVRKVSFISLIIVAGEFVNLKGITNLNLVIAILQIDHSEILGLFEFF